VTRLDVKKNLEALTRGFLKATEAAGATAWKLVIAGDGDPRVRSALERLAADHRARVELTGWLDERERRNLLRRAALFALPSFQENFGLSVAEALAEGTPVLVSKGVNLASAIAEAGAGWVTGTSEDEIASTLSAVLACGELTARAGNARRLAGSYRWSVVTEQLERAYSGVAAQHGRVTLPATA
jgi:glycosyltransferase involved in cell wall biosynthesis